MYNQKITQYNTLVNWMEWFLPITIRSLKMKETIEGLALIPFIFVLCLFHNELADFVGILLQSMFNCLG